LDIQNNISLKPYNTFGIDVNAKRFIEVTSLNELREVVSKEKNIFLLGGGSNMLLTNDIDSLVVFLNLRGKEVIVESDTHKEIKIQAGENWHEFVMWCVKKNLGGLENLSLIPGNVGACPIQNIGAYGVEVKDTICEVEALEITSNQLRTFTNKECGFGYRNSVFKNELKGKYIITSVTFTLTSENHKINTNYGVIENELNAKGISTPSIKDISDAIIKIRKSKLPDPAEIGNCGSFFKNPVIDIELFKTLQKKYPNIPNYPISATQVKVPAGWLIEQAGFKGKRFGDAGIHKNQALVLVNYNNATGKEIHILAKKIQQTIHDVFSIQLEIEVNII